MFLTEPFPSTVLFLTRPDTNRSQDRSQWGFIYDVITKAADYPDIKICIALAFNPSDESDWSLVNQFVDVMGGHNNRNGIGFIGLSFEQLGHSAGPGFVGNIPEEIRQLDRAQSIIQTRGFQFISYYPVGFHGTDQQRDKYQWLQHTNFPQGDNVATLDHRFLNNSPSIVGITHGTDGGNLFPSPACNIDGRPYWNTKALPQGFTDPRFTGREYQPCVSTFEPSIEVCFERDRANPSQARQYNYFIAGNNTVDHGDRSARKFFIGASGVNSFFQWDNPAFRAEMATWINSNRGTFLQGTTR